MLAKGQRDLSSEDLDARFDRELVTQLYDHIAVQPLYTSQDSPGDGGDGMPGLAPFVRGGTLLGGSGTGWDIRQAVDVVPSDPERTATCSLEQLERGASSLLLRGEMGLARAGPIDVDVLDASLHGVYLDLVAISLDPSLGEGGADALFDLWGRRSVCADDARGVLGIDPLGRYASDGDAAGLEAELTAMAAAAAACVERYPNARAVLVDATRYHEAGCSDSEELGCAIATGLAYLRRLAGGGLSLGEAFGQIEFRLAATADQFLTVAKLRAARRLWFRVAEACGVAGSGGQRQHVVTSRAMLSRYDPWVNLLRGTIACFAAGVGGADAVTVEPYDLWIEPGLVSDLGRRMARNTQTILIEESHVAKVVDPAGGSWYVESLTRSVAEQGWAWFQQIEAEGGMGPALASGLVGDRIDQTWERRLSNLGRREDTITGVSDFPNADEEPPIAPRPEPVAEGLPRRRYAAPFEELRSRVDEFERQHGVRPSVLLVRLGSPSDYTARSTWAKSFFETAGVRTQMIDSADVASISSADVAQVACLCSSDDRYAEEGPAVIGRLKRGGVTRVYLAGRRSDHLAPLEAAGVDEFIGVGCDVLASLRTLLGLLDVA